jgi:hypothetical protein
LKKNRVLKLRLRGKPNATHKKTLF